jgi:adenylate cyclase
MTGSSETLIYEFGPFRLHTRARRLLRLGRPLTLPPKAFDALLLLVGKHGRVVEKAEFARELWPDVTVAESNLTQTIYLLRKALGPGDDNLIENVSKRGYRFVAPVRVVVDGETATDSGDVEAVQSIAIVPFRPLHVRDGEPDYLGPGLAEALVVRLGQLGRMRVRPASAFGDLARHDQTPVEVGRRLQVQTVLEGGYDLDSERLRVTAQLIRVSDGRQLWAGSLEERLAEMADVEETIVEKIVIALELRLTAVERARLTGRKSGSADAYREYMKGDYYRRQHTAEGFEKALSHFRRAIEIDRECGLAYTGLAACYELLRLYGVAPPAQVIGEIKTNLDRALSLDERSSEAYKILASVKMSYDWEWDEAERAAEHSVELNPNNTETYTVYNELLMARARFGESHARLRQALEIDPLSPLLAVSLGRLYYYERRFDEAAESLNQLDESARNFPGVLLTLGNIYESQGEYFRATSELMKAVESNPVARQWAMAGLGRIYGLTGMRGEALKVVDELLRLSTRQYVSPYIPAVVFESCGEEEQALGWLERACEEHAPQLALLNVDPRFDRLRHHPRFTALLRRLGFAAP